MNERRALLKGITFSPYIVISKKLRNLNNELQFPSQTSSRRKFLRSLLPSFQYQTKWEKERDKDGAFKSINKHSY